MTTDSTIRSTTDPSLDDTVGVNPRGRASMLIRDDMVGRYRIEAKLGQGGMGVVYRAVDTELDRKVALKLVRAQPGAMLDELTERLRRESRLQARASHPCVITVHDIGRDGERVYVAMELAEGGTLTSWLERTRRPWREIVDVFRRAGEGLAAAHAAGLVHRDFKPDNVLLAQAADDGRVTRVLVSDFGVARAVEAVEHAAGGAADSLEMTMPGALVGTPAYMAPEQLHGKPIDARTDEFAFAISLWQAVYGERPFRGDTLESLMVALMQPAPPLPLERSRQAPRWLERVLRRALSIEPADRYATMAELLAALDWRRRRGRLALQLGGAGGAVLCIAAVATGLALRTPPELPLCDQPHGTWPLLLAQARLASADMTGRAAGVRAHWNDGLATFGTETAELRRATCSAVPLAANWRDRVRCIDSRVLDSAALVDALLALGPDAQPDALRAAPPIVPLECANDFAGSIARRSPPALLRGAAAALWASYYAHRSGDVAIRARAIGQSAFYFQVTHDQLVYAQAMPDQATIEELAKQAEHDGAYEAAALMWINTALATLRLDVHRAHDVLVLADSSLTRAGDPPLDRAFWHAASAFAYASDSKTAETNREIAATLEIMKRAHVMTDLRLVETLGDTELRIGNAAEALHFHELGYQAIETTRLSPIELVSVKARYAASLFANGRVDEASKLVDELVGSLTPDARIDVFVGLAIAMQASIANSLQQPAKAIAVAQQWRARVEHDLGHDDVVAAKLWTEQATAALALGHDRDALAWSKIALERFVQHGGATSYDTADVRVLHGQVLFKLDELSAAREEIEQGLRDLVAASGPSDPLAIQAELALADVMERQHEHAGALAHFDRALEPFRAIAGPLATAGYDLMAASALLALHRDPARARALATGALAALVADPSTPPSDLADAKAVVAKLPKP